MNELEQWFSQRGFYPSALSKKWSKNLFLKGYQLRLKLIRLPDMSLYWSFTAIKDDKVFKLPL